MVSHDSPVHGEIGFAEGADMGQYSEADEEDHEHYEQLIIAVQGGSQHLRSSQAKGLQQY